MNKEKLIRYIKNHGMSDILSDKYVNKKERWLSKYSDEIQSICSIISGLFIGFLSL